jgi:predicted DNA-binding antitoxin AbrB/MazE fold protein
MSKTIEATYDGAVLKPSEALDISPNTRVWITIDTEAPVRKQNFLETAKRIKIEGPSDWSENLEGYLYAEVQTD